MFHGTDSAERNKEGPLVGLRVVEGALPQVRSGDPLFVVDRELRIVSWNRAAEELTGIPDIEAVGRRCWQVLEGRDESGAAVCRPDCPLARSALAGEPVGRQTMRVPTRGGRTPVCLSTLTFGNGARVLALHVLHPEPSAVAGPTDRAGGGSVLTERQLEIIHLLAEGVRAGAIAERLRLSETTVRNHIRATLVRLGCHSQLEAVAAARRRGLL